MLLVSEVVEGECLAAQRLPLVSVWDVVMDDTFGDGVAVGYDVVDVEKQIVVFFSDEDFESHERLFSLEAEGSYEVLCDVPADVLLFHADDAQWQVSVHVSPLPWCSVFPCPDFCVQRGPFLPYGSECSCKPVSVYGF